MPETTGAPPAPLDDALRLDGAVNLVDLARHDLSVVLRELPDSTPLFACVDLAAAQGHLRSAAVLIDKAADAIEGGKR